ncbi:MAG: hypothetical protein ACI9T7_000201 [Oleiphilaceae bacterium]|jgi:hypothetical protein
MECIKISLYPLIVAAYAKRPAQINDPHQNNMRLARQLLSRQNVAAGSINFTA